MAGSTAILAVRIIGDSRDAVKAMDQTSSKASKMGSALKTAAKVGLVGIGVAAVGAAKGLYEMAQAAVEDQASQKQLANTLKQATGATKGAIRANEDYISKMGKLLGVADDDLRPAISRLAVATGDLTKAQSLSMVAMNVAAGTGKSLKTVTEALAKAQTGSLAGLSRLGVATKNAAGETKSLDAIMADLADTYAGSASTAANTLAGQQQRLSLRLSEAKEAIGAKLLPILTKMTAFLLDKVAPGVEKLAENFSKKFGPAIRAVARFVTGSLIPAAKLIVSWFVEKIAPGIAKAVTPVVEGLRKAFEKVASKIEENRPQLEKLFNILKKVAEFIASKVLPILGKVAGEGFKFMATQIGFVIDVISRFIDLIDAAVGKVKDLVNAIKNIDLPSLPDLNPFGRAVATTGAPVGNTYNVEFNGFIGTDKEQVVQVLKRELDRLELRTRR